MIQRRQICTMRDVVTPSDTDVIQKEAEKKLKLKTLIIEKFSDSEI
jgi:hypothetical protein